MKTTKITLALSLAALLSSAVPAFAFRTQQNTARGNGNRTQTQQQRFRGMDRNGDGVITRDEWRGNDNSFRKHDRNRDGILSGDELRGNGKGKKAERDDDDRNEQRGDRGEQRGHGQRGHGHHGEDND